MKLWILLLGILLLGAADPEVRIERKDLSEAINAGDTFTVINLLGDIRARGGGGGKVEVHAVIQDLVKEIPSPDLKFERNGQQLTFKIDAKKSSTGKQDRVDLVFYIPDDVAFHAETERGEIEIKGLQGDVSAVSEEGRITIRSVRGHVEAKNESGTILAELMPNITSQQQNFVTKTGDIALYLWEGMDADVRVQTSGEISTDYTLQIEYDATKEPDKIATSKIGKGASKISASSKRGRIRLLRLLKNLPKAH